jgi:hypothetical protein
MVADLEHFRGSCCRYRQHDKATNGALSDFLSSCGLFQIMHAIRHTVRCVAAMSHCYSVQIEGLAICIYISQATGRQHAARQRTVWHASFATGRQVDSGRVPLATRHKGDNDVGCVVAIDNATRKVYQISHHT